MRRIAAALAVLALLVSPPLRAAAPDLSDLTFRPHPGAALPMTLPLRDETGNHVTLATYFTGGPVVLVLEYLRCRTLCGVTLQNVVAALMALPPAAGHDYQMVAVSIDPRDRPADAAAAREKYLAPYGTEAGSRFHFLTGAGPAVHILAEAVGFLYRYDSELDQYIHPAGFVLATPDGRISRYLYGVAPSAAGLQAGLAAASEGKTQSQRASLLTRILLFCHGEGLPVGRYSLPIEAAFVLANLAATLGIVGLFLFVRRHRRG